MQRRNIVNLLIPLVCKFSILVFGFFLPRLTITNMGSEANGFLSTINEIFVYISLIEGGIGLAALNSLYAPISHNSYSEISDILTATQIRYRKVTLLYLCITIIIAFIFPVFLETNISYRTMVFTILAQGLGGAGVLFLSSGISQFLVASGRNYVKEVTHLGIYYLTSLSKVILIIYTRNIAIVALSHTVFCLVEGILYRIYIRRRIPQISYNSPNPNFSSLSEKKYFLIHQISSVIFSATDIFVVSIFCSLNEASIYAVYALIFTAINKVISSVFDSLKYILGNAYVSGIERYKKVHDLFDTVYLAVVFALYYTAYMLANDFIGLYTRGADIIYVDKNLPILFASVYLLSSCRDVCNNTHNIGHRVKQNIIPTIIESMINLSVSLFLVRIIGIYGVLLGTICALMFRTNQTIIYTNRFILNRSSWNTYRLIFTFLAIGFVLVVIKNSLDIPAITGYAQFILYGFVTTIISGFIYLLAACMLNKKVWPIISEILHVDGLITK